MDLTTCYGTIIKEEWNYYQKLINYYGKTSYHRQADS